MLRQNKEMTTKDMRQAIIPLIQMCTDGLTFLEHDNSLLNQTRRNYIASVLLPYMSDLAKKVSEDCELLFGDSVISRINNISQASTTYKTLKAGLRIKA